MTLLLDISLKVSLVLVVGLLGGLVLRRGSASSRHWVLTAALGCAAAVPLLVAVLPAWIVPVEGAMPAPLIRALEHEPAWPAAPTRIAAEGIAAVAEPAPQSRTSTALVPWLGVGWLVGVSLGLTLLVAGLARLTWLGSRATPMNDERWRTVLHELSSQYGIRQHVRLLRSTHPTLLVTWGAVRPTIIVPVAAQDWTGDRIRIVLAHELAHVRRRDWLVLIGGCLLRSVYWFNPLVWLACRRLRQESERACDDAVLTLGISGQSYAEHLLELARALRGEHAWAPAPAIARPSSLERRVTAMLDGRINRTPLAQSAAVAAFAALLVITFTVARVDLTAQEFSTVSGVALDSQGRLLPNVTMTLVRGTNGAKYEIRTDAAGRYEFVGLPRDEYVVEAKVPGFRNVQDRLTTSGGQLLRNFMFEVGTLEETITVTGAPPPSATGPDAVMNRVPSPEALRSRFAQTLAECDPSSGNPAVGGRVRPPRKIKDVRPVYPEGLRSAGIGGTVRLDAVIGVDGRVREAKPVAGQTVHVGLIEAASDAVMQWEFDGTLLNCVPVEVEMEVSVSFRPA